MEALLALIIMLVIVGAILYIVRLLPIDANIKQIIVVVVVVVLVIYLLTVLFGYLPRIAIPH